MLGLPKSTELNRQLPKKSVYEKFCFNTNDKEKFDNDIKKLVIVNEISPSTVSAKEGKEIFSFYIMYISLKNKDYDDKNIETIAKKIDQKILFILDFEDISQLAVWNIKLFKTKWKPNDEHAIILKGLDIDDIWTNIVLQIGEFQLEDTNTLSEQIQINIEKERLTKKIEQLQKQVSSEKQPRRKYEMFQELKKLEDQLSNKKSVLL